MIASRGMDASLFEVIEEYELQGEKRFRVRVKGTILVFNVRASSPEEAVGKAKRIMQEMGLDSILEALRDEAAAAAEGGTS